MQRNEEQIRYPFIMLADGTTKQGTIGQDGSVLWVWLDDEIRSNEDFLELAGLFADPEATGTIVCHTSERYSYSAEGCTRLMDISVDAETKRPKIRLRST